MLYCIVLYYTIQVCFLDSRLKKGTKRQSFELGAVRVDSDEAGGTLVSAVLCRDSSMV